MNCQLYSIPLLSLTTKPVPG